MVVQVIDRGACMMGIRKRAKHKRRTPTVLIRDNDRGHCGDTRKGDAIGDGKEEVHPEGL